MLQNSVFIGFFLAAMAPMLATSSPVTATLAKRDPSDKSGKAQMAFTCDDATIPNPGGAGGEGEGGTGLFTTDLTFTDEGGNKIKPAGCTADGGYCSNCLIKGGGLSSPTNVTACSNPAGGACSLTFKYNGYDYNTENKEPKCGHEGGGFQAFSNTKTAICYFDV